MGITAGCVLAESALLSDIIPEIDRVILMRDGEIADDGAKDEVLTAASLRKLFGVKVELARSDGYYHLW